jgi:hypothetical protein
MKQVPKATSCPPSSASDTQPFKAASAVISGCPLAVPSNQRYPLARRRDRRCGSRRNAHSTTHLHRRMSSCSLAEYCQNKEPSRRLETNCPGQTSHAERFHRRAPRRATCPTVQSTIIIAEASSTARMTRSELRSRLEVDRWMAWSPHTPGPSQEASEGICTTNGAQSTSLTTRK